MYAILAVLILGADMHLSSGAFSILGKEAQAGGLPWWFWLLVIIVIIVLVIMAFFLWIVDETAVKLLALAIGA